MVREDSLMPRHGGYRKLKSFQIAQLAYDVTVRFCERHVDKFSRTRDQMVQAARSGVQNIAEGSKASGTSKKTELKLTNVARASLEELRLDYEDFLRQRNLPVWERPDPRRGELINARCKTVEEVEKWVASLISEKKMIFTGLDDKVGSGNTRAASHSKPGAPGSAEVSRMSTESTRFAVPKQSTASTQSTKSTKSARSAAAAAEAEIMANAVLVLIAVACSLLDRQLTAQAKAFEEEGGFTERLYRRRVQSRNSN